jgi:uncharacterized membrane protein YfcA
MSAVALSNPGVVAALTIAVFLGGLVSGFSGFAFSAAAGAILLHFLEPIVAIPLMMCCSVASQMSSLAVLRRLIQWREILPLLLGGVVGIPISLYLLTLTQPHTFRIAFGIFLAGYAMYMLAKPVSGALRRLSGPTTRLSHAMVGFAGGLFGGLTAMPGALPVIWCDLRGISKEQQRGLVQPFILGMQVFALILLVCTPGALHRELLPDFVLAVPALAAGTLMGVWLFGKIDDRSFAMRSCHSC